MLLFNQDIEAAIEADKPPIMHYFTDTCGMGFLMSGLVIFRRGKDRDIDGFRDDAQSC